jgi:hypothetical protein
VKAVTKESIMAVLGKLFIERDKGMFLTIQVKGKNDKSGPLPEHTEITDIDAFRKTYAKVIE